MYLSIYGSILVDEKLKNQRTDVISRLIQMGFNVIPVSGKFPPCIEWKPYQTRQVTIEEIKEWMGQWFVGKNGKKWKADLLNFGLVTGATPVSDRNIL